MTAQGGSSGYSYYASQTVRTLRGLLDAGVNATGWSSSSTTSRAWASTFTSAEQVDTLRPNGLHERDGEVPGLPRRSSGAGKKISRPSVNQLFDVPQHHEEESVIDQQAAKKVEVPVRHNNLKSSSGDNANNGRLQGPQLDRVLFHTGPSRDPYNPDSNEELPLLALCPCNLPQELTDLIVSQLSNRLDSYAQEPYMLIIFASPSNPIPVQHLIRYYRGLSSEIRRNIQRVWICHAGLFTKIAVRLFLNTIVSGKVTRKGKVKLVDSLNALASDVDLSNIEIPPDVLIHDYKSNGKLSFGKEGSPVFGASLSQHMSGGQLPLPISQAIQYLRTPPNLQTVGLFRKVPSMTTLDVCKSAYDSKIPINLSQWPESTILAGSIIKNYLRCLKYPVFPSGMYDAIKNCPKLEDEAIQYIKDTILPKLREDHPDGGFTVVLLEEILSLLRDVAAFKDVNQMDSHNLAVVFLPVLVRSADIRQDALMCTMPRKVNSDKRMQQEGQQGESSLGYILKLCIDRYDEVFSLRRDAERREVVQSADVTENSSRSASATSHSSTEQSCEGSNTSQPHRTTRRRNNSTLRLLGSPGTIKKKLNGKVVKSEATRESARGLFSRE